MVGRTTVPVIKTRTSSHSDVDARENVRSCRTAIVGTRHLGTTTHEPDLRVPIESERDVALT